MIYLFIFILLVVIEVFYFKLAEKLNIVDKPNQRSLHFKPTIRGGGILFPISMILFYFIFDFQYMFFIIGLILISVVSFLDDIYNLPNKYRIFIHFVSASLLLYQFDLFNKFGILSFVILILIVGIVNAYNFMDGINGLTGGYSLINLSTLIAINTYNYNFINSDFLIFITFGILIFDFFNFRNKAICFAGDVGSISIAFILIFVIGNLILETNQIVYILFFVIYGLDTVLTIIFRIFNGENIFRAHNKHLFQLMVQKLGFSHLKVSLIYILIQFFINFSVVYVLANYNDYINTFGISMILVLLITYLIVRKNISVS
jgi:UDP-GlcNAc:undecaprenyl-phosphate GlcNAc-1-phosphate transferase